VAPPLLFARRTYVLPHEGVRENRGGVVGGVREGRPITWEQGKPQTNEMST
jgi:hypothetical protein